MNKTRINNPAIRAQREKFEAELAAIRNIPPAFLRLISAEGFIDYYLSMRDLYPSYREAYERLEDFHITLTGRRRYSEFCSFRKIVERKLRSYAHP